VFRRATIDDAPRIAALHADSWRRHYRGAYADSFLDGDVEADRLSVWSARMATPGNTATILAEQDGRLVGFVHVLLDDDPRWGSLLDNLHVVNDQRRTGLGTKLLVRAAEVVAAHATRDGMYLWVLEQNTAAQQFYLAKGGECVEKAPVAAVAGNPARLNGDPLGLRMFWPDVSPLLVTDR
jgi:ribosomal protein S18 acetylase RimI-like enzyme